MLKWIGILLIELMLLNIAQAQPGGGGGLNIRHYYAKDNNKIICIDSLIAVKQYSISGSRKVINQVNTNGFLLAMNYNYAGKYEHNQTNNRRLLICYKRKKMIIDFMNLMQENGAGYTQTMDSIVFDNKHWVCKLNTDYVQSKTNILSTTIDQKLQNGLTTHSTKVLLETSVLAAIEPMNLDFENNISITNGFELNKLNVYKKTDVSNKIQKIFDTKFDLNNPELLHAYNLLAHYYHHEKNDLEALYYVTKKMKIEETEYDYELRKEIYTNLKRYDDAMNDYNYLVKTMENKGLAIAYRSSFMAKHLGQYRQAKNELDEYDASLAKERRSQVRGGWSEMNAPYFEWANTTAQLGYIDTAAVYYIKAMESGLDNTSSKQYIEYFDSLAVTYPTQAEFQLCKALALYFCSLYQAGRPEEKTMLNNAAIAVEAAEKLGYDKFKINYYRAMILNYNKKTEDALIAIENAIKLKPDDAESYSMRYQIRRNLNQAIPNHTDPDLIKYRALLAQQNEK